MFNESAKNHLGVDPGMGKDLPEAVFVIDKGEVYFSEEAPPAFVDEVKQVAGVGDLPSAPGMRPEDPAVSKPPIPDFSP